MVWVDQLLSESDILSGAFVIQPPDFRQQTEVSREDAVVAIRHGGSEVAGFTQSAASFIRQGQETRIREGLQSQQRIGQRLEKIWQPALAVSSYLATRVRAAYELWFDQSPTRIEDVQLTQITATSAVIEWKTSKLVRGGKINFGPTTSYGEEVFIPDTPRDHHRIELQNLRPGTTYYFEIMNRSSSDYVFDAYYALTTLPGGQEVQSGTFVPQEAVVEGEESVTVYGEPFPDSNVLVEANPGTVYRALVVQGDWVSVLLPDGREGWVLRDEIILHNQEGISTQARHRVFSE